MTLLRNQTANIPRCSAPSRRSCSLYVLDIPLPLAYIPVTPDRWPIERDAPGRNRALQQPRPPRAAGGLLHFREDAKLTGGEPAVRILAILAFLFAAATPLAAQPAEPPVVAEARSFMAAYATALLQGDRAGIAARYDRTGAWFLGNGRKRFETHAQLAAHYAGADWQPPHPGSQVAW